ncbi:response regulator [Halomonas sp. PAMB 3232]|uniref:response regulator n=1 Tax=Halomonas sp. PAMB 3232 TaxID=3075221 RepID=UPI0028A0700F|nr:response regulator [Halomonas sp. PAMB 3232]WNL38566.1 response regulator [Halomonas sp. PAMB 3232]
MRILVVDDDELAGEMTAAVLASQHYTPVLALNAMEAITQLERHSDIAAIVSDMHMPLINGTDLCSMLREQDVTLPFILLTGDSPDSDLLETPGIHACLQKEADMASTLCQTLESALGAHSPE